ncbi:MAG: DUF4127 family protein [Clostridiales bacterium]|nr:DUF4127 family protein [Clostridiales bacterium]
MKKMCLIWLFVVLWGICPVYGAEIFTAPIDSRPVSTDYLEALAAVSGDGFTCVTEDSLDYFSGKGEGDHIGDSASVREQIYNMASENNSEDSTFIINLTSYLTGGLVGSRSGVNYGESSEAAAALEKLMTDFPLPNYYINMSMPRTLPDSRFGDIWTTEKAYPGLGSFYLKANPDSGRALEISTNYSRVSAAQFLLEWSYVKNHQAMGELTDWETAFLKCFTANFENKDPYRQYLNSYKSPYESIAEAGAKLMKLYKKGCDFELIISEDDFQLPDFIIYLNDDNLLGDDIKYSFALNYMQNTLYGEAKDVYGVTELEKALEGKGTHINFIFGTDEVPQLIYARDLSKRTGIIPSLNLKSENAVSSVAKFDVMSAEEVMASAVNFVCAGKRRAVRQTDIFLFDYNGEKNYSAFVNSMETDYNKGNDIALIELYTTNQTAAGENYLFNILKERSLNGYNFGFHSLAAYSAWNTTANAVGLGVADAAVYSVNRELKNDKAFVKAALEVLLVHGLEDGWYNCNGKRQLYGYYPYYDENNVEKLRGILEESGLAEAFENKSYETSEGMFTTEKAEISECNFPWNRTFECYIDVNID